LYSLKLEDSPIIANLPPEHDGAKGSSMGTVFGIISLEGGLVVIETALQNLKK
jgi:hypothetical protein